MKKIFEFGKIAYCNPKIKNNLVEVEIRIIMREEETIPYFAISGGVWNHIHTDYVMCGQCLDSIAKTIIGSNPTFQKIYRLWNLYHLRYIDKIPNEDLVLIQELLGRRLEE